MRLTSAQVKWISPILQTRNLSYKNKTTCWRLEQNIAGTHLKLIFTLSGSCFKNVSNFETPSWDIKRVNIGKNHIQIHNRKFWGKKKPWVSGVLRPRLSTSLKHAEGLLLGLHVAGGWVAFHSRILWWCFRWLCCITLDESIRHSRSSKLFISLAALFLQR